MTETSPVVTLSPQGIHNYSTIGYPIPNVEIKIAGLDDPSYKGLGPNETGEGEEWCSFVKKICFFFLIETIKFLIF